MTQGIRLGGNFVAAWWLLPEAFGLMAIVTIWMQGLRMFSDFGIQPAIIQNERGAEPEFLDSAWMIQIFRGFGLCLICLVSTVPMAWFFAQRDPGSWQLLGLLPAVGCAAIVAGFESPKLHLASRNLLIGKLTILAFVRQCVNVATMLTCAYVFKNVWALVIGGFVGTTVHVILSHLWLPGPRGRLRLNRDCAREILRFGKWIFASTLFMFLSSNIDRLVLASLLPLEIVGLYHIAYVLADIAIQIASRLTSAILYPVLADYRNDHARMVEVCLRARRPILWASSAACIGICLVAPTFFKLYREHYAGCGPIARWLTVFVWVALLVLTINRLPLAMGKPRVLFNANVATSVVSLPLSVLGFFQFDIPGFIIGLAIGQLVKYVVLTAAIGEGRREIHAQTLRFTVAVSAYCAGSLLVLGAIESFWLNLSVMFVLAALPQIGAARMVWVTYRGGRKKSSAAPAT